MAQKTIVQIVDDLDQRELDGDAQTVRFALDQAQYEIDLSTENARRLHEALAPFIAAGRRIGGRSGAGTGGSVKAGATELQAIRQWAKDHGMQVAERGRVSKEVQEAYRAAN
ncbi:MAG: Lsr2 family protein [Propionibacteriaceae bacterium]